MHQEIRLLEVVALLTDLPERGLRRGQVGTVVEIFTPDAFDVEFCDDQGRSYALLSLRSEQLLPLYFQSSAEVA